MRYIELFAGIGGFRYGLEASDIEPTYISKESQQEKCSLGGKRSTDEREVLLRPRNKPSFCCVYANEWDKYAAQIYRGHYGQIDTRDIRDVSADEIPEHDLLTGGFPCQAFSIAGKLGGFDDTRGTLFFEIARILSVKKPRHLLLENVKGLLSHDEGKTFNRILGVLSDLGYRVEWMVLNSKHFGVPQNRERVFIVGHLRGKCAGQIFPVRRSDSRDIQDSENQEGQECAWALRERDYKDGTNFWGERELREITEDKSDAQRVYDPEGIGKALKGLGGGQGAKTGLYAITRGRSNEPYTEGEISPTVRQSDKHDIRIIDGLYAMRGRNPENPSDRETGSPTEQRLELNSEGVTNTLSTVQKDNLWVEETRIRRLTPIECERLQSFEDGYTEFGMLEDRSIIEISDTQRYKCLGNAVTTSVITAIGEKIIEQCAITNTVTTEK